ncbi:MAG TPA: enoyl-CoA hydratase/isomerase family protein [Marmoricola sp.]
MSAYTQLDLDLSAPVATITLARPERLNALSPTLLRELTAASEEVSARDDVKVVIVRGDGRAFSTGFDLDAAVAEGPSAAQVDLGRQMAEAVSGIPVLTIAAIHGHCIGGGLVLAAACDLRVAEQSTRFRIPEVDFGIPLAWGGIPRLVRELGPALTKELVLTCRPFDAAEALAVRFLNRVVADGTVADEVAALAGSLAAKPRFLITHTKQSVDALVEDAYSTAQSIHDADLTMAATRDEESVAAMMRFLEERGRTS